VLVHPSVGGLVTPWFGKGGMKTRYPSLVEEDRFLYALLDDCVLVPHSEVSPTDIPYQQCWDLGGNWVYEGNYED
jgi:hypothetical protein